MEKVSIWAVAIGFLGARTGYVITHSGAFVDRPWAVLFIWEGGLALYGGLTAGALTAIFLLRRWRGDVFAYGDAIAVGIPLAQAIGRFGNYFNQELPKRPSSWRRSRSGRSPSDSSEPEPAMSSPTPEPSWTARGRSCSSGRVGLRCTAGSPPVR